MCVGIYKCTICTYENMPAPMFDIIIHPMVQVVNAVQADQLDPVWMYNG